MAITFKTVEACEAPKVREAGEYLMKITSAVETTFNSGKEGLKVIFEDNDGLKIYNNFFFEGKAANNLLTLLGAVGLYDGNGWENLSLDADDLVGLFVYVDCEKDKENKYLQCKFCGFRKYESEQPKPEPKNASKAPF